MFKMKKLLSMVLAVGVIASMSTSAFASENAPFEKPMTDSTNSENAIVLNDPTLIQELEELESFERELEVRFGIELKNKELTGQFYYDDSPFMVDTIEGPMSTGPVIEFEDTTTGGVNVDAGVSVGVDAADVEASFGVDVSKSKTVRRTYTFDPIPAGKYLTYEAYVKYNVYEYDIYQWNKYVGTGSYWVPVGVVVLHDLH